MISSSLFVVAWFLNIIGLASSIPFKEKEEAKGVVLLDAITFPKLIPSNNYVLMVLVAQKHQIGDYGTDSIRADYFDFADFVQRIAEVDNEGPSVLFSQVLVNGAENIKLAEDLGLEADFVHPALFVIPRGRREPVRYPAAEPYHKDSLVRFLASHTDFYFRIPGTLKGFDELAALFMKDVDDREQLLKQTEAKYTAFSQQHPSPILADLQSAKFYVDIMTGIMKSGDDYIQKQIDRLENMTKKSTVAKLTVANKIKLKYKLNILKSFRSAKVGATTVNTTPRSDL